MLSLHYNEANSCSFVNGAEIYKFKAKDSEIVATPLCSFYPHNVTISKCSGSCKNINDPYAKMCILDVVKNINSKLFDLMSRTNETKYIKLHETCNCKCRLDVIVCNNKQCWNEDKFRCECKELVDKGICHKRFIWNPSNLECNVINHVMLENI